jgi:monovalent cation:H+ antiporter-2, CPA2 family
MEQTVLTGIIIILASAVAIVIISLKLKIPTVIGFLVTGILIGPGVLRWVNNSEIVKIMADIGVVMLLFVVGLEFSLDRLKSISRSFWFGGSFQVILTGLSVSGIFYILGFTLAQGIFYGFIITLSSTAVVLRELNERREIDTLTGRTSIGILLFQDFAIVPMSAVIPFLAGSIKVSWSQLGLRASIIIAAAVIVLMATRKLFPFLFQLVARTRSREIFILTTLLVCLGMAFLTSILGLSPALGAFIAGIIISESHYSHQVAADILPFRDLFNSIFFISIGMSLNVPLVWALKSNILIMSIGIIIVKALVLILILKLLRYTAHTSIQVAFSLAQIGEFSFVLANMGSNSGLLSKEGFQVFIAASIITIFLTPLLIALTRKDWFRKRGKTGELKKKLPDGIPGLKNHVIIAGYGLNGSNLARVLSSASIPFVILELNPDNIKKARKEKYPVIFGDVSGYSVLISAGIQHAKIIVFTISDIAAARRGVRLARQLNHDVFIIVRTRFVAEIDELYKLGANHVIPEEFETSLELFTKTLEEYHIPANVIQVQRELIRSEGYSILRGKPQDASWSDKVMNILTAGTVQAFLLDANSFAVKKTLRDLNLRHLTGATVISIVRGGKATASPGPDFELQSGDILVLVANHMDMNRAFSFLRSPGPQR